MTNARPRTGARGKRSRLAWPCQPPAFFRALQPRGAKNPVRVYVRLCKLTPRSCGIGNGLGESLTGFLPVSPGRGGLEAAPGKGGG